MIPSNVQKTLAAYHTNKKAEEKLEQFISFLLEWNQRINLIGKSTEKEIWERHILDSARLLPLIPEGAKILTDLGSGAGLPGLILAIFNPKLEAHLIESDLKKAVFLQEAFRVTQTRGTVHAERIEKITPWQSDVITARALAPLNQLIKYAQPFMGTECLCLFPKGCKAREEIEEAKRHWKMEYTLHRSDPKEESVIVAIKQVSNNA